MKGLQTDSELHVRSYKLHTADSKCSVVPVIERAAVAPVIARWHADTPPALDVLEAGVFAQCIAWSQASYALMWVLVVIHPQALRGRARRGVVCLGAVERTSQDN